MRALLTRSDKTTIGEISIERDNVFFLSDNPHLNGADAKDKKNWKYSWYMSIAINDLKDKKMLAAYQLILLDRATGFFTRRVSY